MNRKTGNERIREGSKKRKKGRERTKQKRLVYYSTNMYMIGKHKYTDMTEVLIVIST